MSYCPKCGAQLQEGTNFCPACGQPIENQSMNEEQANNGYAGNSTKSFTYKYEASNATANSNLGTKWYAFVCVGCFLLAFGYLVYGIHYLSGNFMKSEDMQVIIAYQDLFYTRYHIDIVSYFEDLSNFSGIADMVSMVLLLISGIMLVSKKKNAPI